MRSPGQETDLRRIYGEAQAAQAKGDLPTATQKYEQLVQIAPGMAEAQANLGELYYRQGQLPKATQAFRRASALNPRLAGPLFYLGVMALENKSPGEALSCLSKAATLEPSNPLTFSYLGYAHFARHDNEAAFQALARAIELNANHPNVLYTLAEAASNLADSRLSSLDSHYPKSAFAELKDAHFRELKRDWAGAAAFYRAALEQMPENRELRRKLDWLQSQAASGTLSPPPSDELIDGSLRFIYSPPEGNAAQSSLLRSVESVKDLKNPDAESLYREGQAYQSVALLASLVLTNSFSDSFRAHQLRGKMLASQSQPDEAIAEYKSAVKLQPDAPDLHFAIGNIYWEQGQLDEAQSELEQELKANPGQPYCLYELGDIASRQHREAEAERFLQRSLTLRSSLREARLDLAKLYQSQNQPAKAIANLRQAIALEPNDPSAHYSLMILLKRQHQLEAAANELALYRKCKAQADANAPQVSKGEQP